MKVIIVPPDEITLLMLDDAVSRSSEEKKPLRAKKAAVTYVPRTTQLMPCLKRRGNTVLPMCWSL